MTPLPLFLSHQWDKIPFQSHGWDEKSHKAVTFWLLRSDFKILLWGHRQDEKGFSSHGGDQKIIMDIVGFYE